MVSRQFSRKQRKKPTAQLSTPVSKSSEAAPHLRIRRSTPPRLSSAAFLQSPSWPRRRFKPFAAVFVRESVTWRPRSQARSNEESPVAENAGPCSSKAAPSFLRAPPCPLIHFQLFLQTRSCGSPPSLRILSNFNLEPLAPFGLSLHASLRVSASIVSPLPPLAFDCRRRRLRPYSL